MLNHEQYVPDFGVSENKRLANHSARKFLVQTLTGTRIAERDIMQVTGHKNVQSIRNYSRIPEGDHRGIINLGPVSIFEKTSFRKIS